MYHINLIILYILVEILKEKEGMNLKENRRVYRREGTEGREKLCNYSIISKLKEIILKGNYF